MLLISHHAEDETLLRRMLAGPKWLFRTTLTLADAIRALKRGSYSVAICESDLLDGTWRDLLDSTARLKHGPEIIVASRLADASLWAEALNIGACDVLSKPFSPKEVLHVVGCAWQQWTRRQMPSQQTPDRSVYQPGCAPTPSLSVTG